ncbi:peptidoglycan DD-metalloendopeptidase family protein [Geoalkalibacter halelectricus]|uniref:Peptidoglycan DD-metalloendopeptidase family protein n=1 Tax=Geoalkalibacter halelectricus TaxID=2847045 RepID=A0ABY5ZJ80_9BACT|nr:peptidoglycan DD-metalloendopeptidase family protein [Geoalkalibacter halelectricus]MDO3378975.1 peptidoglycan DD-metalloendopeptidase family protein [Geoalkalibacter halelectricus]UWZ78791.1 peptidoglycan DD-metalloendopeptidase family protein [Geoalkalibacter halelectricus]
MNAIRTSARRQKWKKRQRLALWGLVPLVLLVALLALRSPGSQGPEPAFAEASSGKSVKKGTPTELPVILAEDSTSAPAAPEEPDHVITYAIAQGDTLSSIFDRFNLGQQIMYQVLSADEPLLALDILRPGNLLTFRLNEDSRCLEEMELFIHAGNRVVYRRGDNGSFDYEEIVIPGDWEQQVLAGEINGSFYLSARNVGLSERETAIITDLFKDQLNFAREIRAGDRFQVVRSQQWVEGEFTGQSRIEGVRILRRSRLHSAFLFEDGNYYDHKGESLARAFRRYPMNGNYRVSSAFNPARRHPVTGRVAPHNGVDFAMPIGTPVLSTGDGVVTRVHNHPFAGKYIEIQHGGNYVTRYLHLDRILVRRGQSVARGERIALSGNTGRSTGPHLHFELHVKGRPVDPLRANIPMAAAVPQDKRRAFDQRVAALVQVMEHPEQQIAMRAEAAGSGDKTEM